jgi:Glycosyl transferase family 2
LRASDTPSQRVAERHRSDVLHVLTPELPGVLAALRLGVSHSTGAIVAFTDDDAEPREDWLAGLTGLLAQQKVGASGGRDVIPGQTSPRRSGVGRFTWYGKLVGNHHLGCGPPRDVDALKGVNMAFRAECLALPSPDVLRGDGAEVYFELLCARWVTRLGWRLVYDPAIEVAHEGAPRSGHDRRGRPSAEAIRDAAHNFVVAATALDRGRLPRQVAYSLVMGSRDAPGLGRALLALVRGEREVVRRFAPSLAGTLLAIRRMVGDGVRTPVIRCDELRRDRDMNVEVA